MARTAASRTCLIIDDDVDFAVFVQRVAEGLGLQARALTDPTLLEQSLAAGDPDVITLDMDMPVRNGLAVLEELVIRGLDKRVIIISGTPPDHIGSTKPRVGKAHVVAVLTKPARKRDIELALLKAIGEAQLASAAPLGALH
jgi:CheY-like chemotaxis protein